MKYALRAGVLAALFISAPAFSLAFDPVQGFYLGVFGGLSHGPSQEEMFIRRLPNEVVKTLPTLMTVSYTPVGGGGGAVLGYKLANFRGELEFFYNRISTGPARLSNGCTLETTSANTPTGNLNNCRNLEQLAMGYEGSSSVAYGFFNAYFDFFTRDSDTNVVPYLGIGIGKGRVKDVNNIVATDLDVTFKSRDLSYSAPALQGIAGVGLFIDDLTWIGMDIRYATLSSTFLPKRPTYLDDRKYAVLALMFNINFLLDKGAINFDC